MRRPLCLFAALILSFAAGRVAPAIAREFDVGIVLSDGTRLSADVYRPADDGRHPVVVARTPYDNSTDFGSGEYYAGHGYVYVTVDSRGRYDSQGEFYPYLTEGDDGAEVIAWSAEQPWSDGRVITTGGSYLGFDQWLAAAESPPALQAMNVMVSPVDYYDSPAHTGGAFNLAGRLPWTTMVDARTNQSLFANDWQEGLSHLPVIEADTAIGRDLDTYRDWAEHADRDSYWDALSVAGRWADVGVPVLHQGGWYDEFTRGTLAGFVGMRCSELPAQVRDRQVLLVGPWTHGMSMGPIGQPGLEGVGDFGESSQIDHRDLARRWFDHVLDAAPSPFAAPVRLFVMGENAWRDLDDWPPSGTYETRWYLHGDGTAGGGRGSLSLRSPGPPRDEPPDRYRYDPANPVPTSGGGTCCVYPGRYPEILPLGSLGSARRGSA